MTGFKKALPIWVENRETEINLSCAFATEISGNEPIELAITASCLYRIFVNGKLIGYGPARAAHGYFRIDRYLIESLKYKNELYIEVAGYNTISYYTLNQPSFLQAEVLKNGRIICFTGNGGGFVGGITDRLQKTARFSYQRPFTEYYRHSNDKLYRYPSRQAVLTPSVSGTFLERNVHYPSLEKVSARLKEKGTFRKNLQKETKELYFLRNARLKIYAFDELERYPAEEVQKYEYKNVSFCQNENNCFQQNEYGVWQMPDGSETGFLHFRIKVIKNSIIYVLFDEVDSKAENKRNNPINVDFLRNDTYNIVGYELSVGEYELITFEVYTAQFIKLCVAEGEIVVLSGGMILYSAPESEYFFKKTGTAKIDKILTAAMRTFRQNSLDILMDCPSRERAGWLCDSFFLGRAEQFFTKKNIVEKNFLENYILAPGLEHIPSGMLPMCYPADFEIELYIPNWAMFFVLEIEDYYYRTGDKEIIERAESKVFALLDYLSGYENEFGLLENLKGWIFVEWSAANDPAFTKGVNFPTNMLYSAALESAGKIYKNSNLILSANEKRKRIRKMSYDGSFFADNALRNEKGKLERTKNYTETCQYFAFFFGTATKKTYPDLFKKLQNQFGPKRDTSKVFPEVQPSNAFIGNYLRLDVLRKNGLKNQVLSECVDYFYKMAETTNTLWEFNKVHASLNHGFASYVAKIICDCIFEENMI